MKRHLDFYVEGDLFHASTVPPKSSRQYFPKLKDIRNHMYKASVKLKFSKIDQENLEIQVDEWSKQRPNDNFFFEVMGKKSMLPLLLILTKRR